jgi:hypothetical protein
MPLPRGARTLWVGVLAAASATLIALVVALVLWPLWLESRMPPARQVIPDRLSFGTVRAGAIVEASARVFVHAVDPSGVRARVRAPWFIKVEELFVGGPEAGTSRGTVFCDVFFRVSTSRPGEHASTIKVIVAGERGEIQVAVTVAPEDPALPRVLVAETPFDRVSTDEGSAFDPLLDVVRSSKADVSYARRLPEDLSGFDVLLLAGSELHGIQDHQIALVKRFVAGGGRLILAANYFFRGTVAKANAILEGYGIVIEDAEPDRQVETERIAADPLTEGVKGLSFFRPSPVKATDPGKAKVLVESLRGDGTGYVAVWRGEGEVVVLGQSLWWHWIGKEGASGDNGRLLRNLLDGKKLRGR